MRTGRIPGLLAFALSLAPVPAQAVTVPPVPLSRALRAAGSYTIPAAGAGIWSAADTAQACDGHSTVISSTALDTLCAGAAFGPDTTQYQCSGTFTDTDFDITCTGQITIAQTCSSTFSEHLQGTRSGDVVRIAYTLETTYAPALCASYPDECELTTGTLTRVGSAPQECNATPVHVRSWGQLKLLYR